MKVHTSFCVYGTSKLRITSIFVGSALMPSGDIRWSRTTPCVRIILHFSLLRQRLTYLHCVSTFSKLFKASSKYSPWEVKSSIKDSMVSWIRFLKMLRTTRWNVVGVLHNMKGNTQYEKVPRGHVNVVFSWSFSAILIWL